MEEETPNENVTDEENVQISDVDEDHNSSDESVPSLTEDQSDEYEEARGESGPFLPSSSDEMFAGLMSEDEEERERGGVRLIPRILQLFREQSSRHHDDEDEDRQDDPRPRDVDQDLTFDCGLPGQHLYLGASSEVSGRTMFEDNEVLTLPIIHYPHFVLMPGQIFPLTLFDPGSITMVRNALAGKKTFGMISAHMGSPKLKGCIGTTAEIFEYSELSDQADPETGTPGFKIKAKGRQRFRLQSTHTDNHGVKMGLVSMLPEISLTDPFYSSRLRSCDRKGESGRKRTIQALSPLPTHVHSLYDCKALVSRVHSSLHSCGWYTERPSGRIPSSPEELSWWLAATLPIQDSWKYHLLGINTAIQRLRVELCILSSIQVLVCRRCYQELADQSDIFSMSSEGPQGAFVNPGGHLHETLTVYKAKNLKLVGEPSTEYSWFPGYAWTIAECSRCYNHIGWKFTVAKEGLKPDKFYGFSRKSISSALSSSSQASGVSVVEFYQNHLQQINDEDHSNDMSHLIM